MVIGLKTNSSAATNTRGNSEESLYPVMQFLPVLSLPADKQIPEALRKALALEPSQELSVASPSLQHFVCTREGLCHKKKSLHLFLAAISMLTKHSVATTIWLAQDSSKETQVLIENGAVSVTEGIQLFLQQAGMDFSANTMSIKKGDTLSITDHALLRSLLSRSSMAKVA